MTDEAGRNLDKVARRTAIVRRYAALDRPTKADSELAASDLGITTEYLKTLAVAWRTHGRASMRTGTLRQDRRALQKAIAAAEGLLDLSGVFAPDRVEVERRIRIIGRYLATETIDKATATTFADEYGVGYGAFRRAVAAWYISPEPSKVFGAATHRPGLELRRRNQLIDDAVSDTIRMHGHGMGLAPLHRKVAQLCHERGLRIPSLSLVYDRQLKARALARREEVDLAVCIDHLAIRTAGKGRVLKSMAVLTIVFGASSGRIHAFHVASEPPSAASDAGLLRSYLTLADHTAHLAMLELEAPVGHDWDRLLETIRSSGVSMRTSTDRSLRSARMAMETFGNHIGRIKFGRIDGRVLRALDPSIQPTVELIASMSEHIGLHNVGRLAGPPRIVAEAETDGLLDRLATFDEREAH